MIKKNKPVWFKLFLHQKPVIDCIPNDALGKALKAVMTYFDTGEVTDLDVLEGVAFACMKPGVDAAYEDYAASVEYGAKAAHAKKAAQAPLTLPDPGCPSPTEKEKEEKKEKEIYLYKEEEEKEEGTIEVQTDEEAENAPPVFETEEQARAYWRKRLLSYT